PSRAGGDANVSLAGRNRRLRGAARELDAIVLKALEKNPAARYASASALANDIAAWLEARPVAARLPRVLSARRAAYAAAAVAGSVLLFAVAPYFAGRDDTPHATQSVAVLPFTNTAGDPELEFLIDGLAEDIIHRLSRVPDLKVIARDSAYRHKGVPLDPERVG